MHSMPQPVSLLAKSLLAETRDADDALVRRRALGQSRQRRADLAANAEDDEIAGEFCHVGDERRRRRGHHLFEMVDVAKTIRQRRVEAELRRRSLASLVRGWPWLRPTL